MRRHDRKIEPGRRGTTQTVWQNESICAARHSRSAERSAQNDAATLRGEHVFVGLRKKKRKVQKMSGETFEKIALFAASLDSVRGQPPPQ